MTLILGTEYCKIDSNGRFKFPIALKKQLESEDCRFVIRQGFTAECLELWTYSCFQAEVEELQRRLNPYSIKDAQIMRQMTRANIVEMDSNDRMMIPPERKSVIGDTKEIVLQANGKCIEIWNRAAYDKMNSEIVDFASVVDQRLGHAASGNGNGASRDLNLMTDHGVPSASDAE